MGQRLAAGPAERAVLLPVEEPRAGRRHQRHRRRQPRPGGPLWCAEALTAVSGVSSTSKIVDISCPQSCDTVHCMHASHTHLNSLVKGKFASDETVMSLSCWVWLCLLSAFHTSQQGMLGVCRSVLVGLRSHAALQGGRKPAAGEAAVGGHRAAACRGRGQALTASAAHVCLDGSRYV